MKKNFLAGLKERLTGEKKEKWEIDSEGADAEMDEDMRILSLDPHDRKPGESSPRERIIRTSPSKAAGRPEAGQNGTEPKGTPVSLELPPDPPEEVSQDPLAEEVRKAASGPITLELAEDLPAPEPVMEEEQAAPVVPGTPAGQEPEEDGPAEEDEPGEPPEETGFTEEPVEGESGFAPAEKGGESADAEEFDSGLDDPDRWDMPDETPDPRRWDMPEESLAAPEPEESQGESESKGGIFDRLSFLKLKRTEGGEESQKDEKGSLAEWFSRRKADAQDAFKAGADYVGSSSEEPLSQDDDVEPEFEEGESAGHVILRSGKKMFGGVGRGLLSIVQFLWGFISEAAVGFLVSSRAHLANEIKPRNWKHLFSRYLLTLIIFYYELVFKLSTAGSPLGFSILYILLFSLCWGLLGYLLTTFLKPKRNRQVRRWLILALAVPYILFYFKYQRMGKFYGLADTVPMVSGSTGALLKLIFSVQGILHLILFLLPFAIYTLVLMHMDSCRRIKARRRIRTVVTIIAIWLAAWLLILVHPDYRWDYGREYTFHAATCDFGLLTSVRLDVQRQLLGGKGGEADVVPSTSQTKPAAAETEAAIQAENETEAGTEAGTEAEESTEEIADGDAAG